MKVRIRKQIIAQLLGLPDDFQLIGAETESDEFLRESLCIEFETDRPEFEKAARSERSEGGHVECIYQAIYDDREDPEEYVSKVWSGGKLFLLEVRPHS